MFGDRSPPQPHFGKQCGVQKIEKGSDHESFLHSFGGEFCLFILFDFGEQIYHLHYLHCRKKTIQRKQQTKGPMIVQL
jgi:hypothetical protein